VSLQESLRFDGDTYEEELDQQRLGAQLQRVKLAMASGEWFTLAKLSRIANCSEASASARIRDLRKDRFGAWTIERRRVSGGLHEYRRKFEVQQ
jgi:Fic family protein